MEVYSERLILQPLAITPMRFEKYLNHKSLRELSKVITAFVKWMNLYPRRLKFPNCFQMACCVCIRPCSIIAILTEHLWDIAVDRDTSKSRFKLDHPFVQPYYMKKEFLTFGVTTADYGDCTMQMFDRDRLICECIFSENKMDRKTYNKAIQSYVADTKKNVPKLLEYAQKRRILKKVTDRIGVWL